MAEQNQPTTPEELALSNTVQVEALTRLMVEKGVCTQDEFVEMVRTVWAEMQGKRKGN
jgi:hypothetical protein